MNEILNQMLLTAATNLVISTIGSGVVVSAATEILKAKKIPLPVKEYPRTTAFVLSLGTALFITLTTDVGIIIDTWEEIAVFAFAILLIAANSYNVIVKGLVKDIKTNKKTKANKKKSK